MKNQNQARKKRSPATWWYQAKSPCEIKIVQFRECPVKTEAFLGPQQIADFWHKHVVTAQWFCNFKECLCVFMLNARRNIMGFELVSLGTLDTLQFHARDVFRSAIVGSAEAIIIAHNHPSGDPLPSEADIKMTRDLIRAGMLLRIEVLDHIVIGSSIGKRQNEFKSLRALGYFSAL